MICPNCQTPNKESAKFCHECGHKLSLTCPNCGHENDPGSKFCNNCGHRLTKEPKAPAAEPPPPAEVTDPTQPARTQFERFIPKELASKLEAARGSRAMEGERRVVTMLFCDVTGSTATAEQLDPEEWTEIMNGAFEHMIAPVYKYEGTVGRLMGDSVLAFFGAPIAHEDDPQRAILAGMDIVEAINGYAQTIRRSWDVDFGVRVGINTGLVVVGAVGSDLRMEYTAMGDAINAAARMEQTASPGTVQVAEETYNLVAPLFDFEELGAIEVKGKLAPIRAYRVLGRKKTPGRLRGIEGLESPLIGREQELEQLRAAVEGLERGLGGIITLMGEAGLGKSRLVEELRSGAEDEFSWFETASLSYESDQPYGLFRRLTQRLIDAQPGDATEVLREKIDRLVAEASEAPVMGEAPVESGSVNGESAGHFRRVFESLFGLPNLAGEPPLEGESFKGLFYTAMFELWERQAAHRPVVLIFDDLHWSDSASIELLKHLFPLVDRLPLLFICALRPDRETPGWQIKQVAETEYAHRHTGIVLRPLSASQGGELIDSLLRISDLPKELRERIQEKSEGNPFFVEEVVRSLIDQGVVVRDEGGDRWQATGDGRAIEIPENLQSLLVARMDRLAEDARLTLQLASVVGRTFYYRVLARIVELGQELDRHLLALQRADLIREAARLPELEYLFRHALTQEAAYSTILLKQRREFHGRVGLALEELFLEGKKDLAGALARHFEEARDSQRALKYLTTAGDDAFRLFAMEEAAGHYARALELARQQVDQVDGETLKHLYLSYGRALEHVFRHEEAVAVYQELLEVAAVRDEPSLRLGGLIALGVIYSVTNPVSDGEKGLQATEEALVLSRQLGDRRSECKTLWAMMLLYNFRMQDFEKSEAFGSASLAIARELGWQKQMAITLQDLHRVYGPLGNLRRGIKVSEEARALLRELNELPVLADNHGSSGWLYYISGDLERSLETFEMGHQIARSIGNLWNIIPNQSSRGIVYRERAQFWICYRIQREVLEEIESASLADFLKTIALIQLIFVYADLAIVEPGLELCDQFEALTKNFGELPFVSSNVEVQRARLYARAGDRQAARLELKGALSKFEGKVNPDLTQFYVGVFACEVTLFLGDYEQAISMADEYVTLMTAAGGRIGLPDMHYFKSRALLAMGRLEEAQQAAEEARSVAESIGSRRTLWLILAAQADIAEELDQLDDATELRTQARKTAINIADHFDQPGITDAGTLKAAFLALPEVKSLLGDHPSR